MEYLITNWQELVLIVLAILGVASMIAKMTPTETDDKIIAAIYKVIHGLGLTKK